VKITEVEEQWRFDVVLRGDLHMAGKGAMAVHIYPPHWADHAIRQEGECDALGAVVQRRQEAFSAYRPLK
jgi:uncharacterized membrane protein